MAPNYKTHDPKGWCGDPKRGAALGRPTIRNLTPDTVVRLYVRRVRLDNGGYDVNGTYFGIDLPLYWVADGIDGAVDFMIRAVDREDAKKQIINDYYPNAKFFR